MTHIKKYITGFTFLLLLFFSGCKNGEERNNTEVKNIVLIIGNPSVLSQFHSGSVFPILSNTHFYRFPAKNTDAYQMQSINYAALAIGKTCTGNSVGLDSSGIAQPNLIELASVKGLSTGLITGSTAVHSLPASFIAHLNDRDQFESIALEFLNSPLDFFSGAGLRFFIERKDSINLLKQLENKGYSVYTDMEEAGISKKMAIIIDDREIDLNPDKANSLLQKSTALALQTLSNNSSGFLLIVDGTNVTTANNRMELADFGSSIGKCIDYASQNPGTLIIITSEFNNADFTDGKAHTVNAEHHLPGSTPFQKDSATIYTYGVASGSMEEISESTGIFKEIVNLLHLDKL